MCTIEELREIHEQACAFSLQGSMLKWFDNAPICIAITQNANILFINKEWTRVLGYSMEELENTVWIDIVHPHDLEASLKKTIQFSKKSPDNNQPQTFINRYKHKDNSYIWFKWHMSPADGDTYYCWIEILDPNQDISLKDELIKISEERKYHYEHQGSRILTSN